MQTISQEEFKKRYGTTGVAQFSVAPQKTLTQKASDFSTGFAKGGVQTAIGTSQLLQGLGQRTLALLDPTRNLEQIREQTGFKSLQGEEAQRQNELLKAKGKEEKIGKAAEFLAEFLFPVSKTSEVAGVLSKGKGAVTATVENLAEKAQGIGDDVVEGGVKVKDKLIDLASKLDEKTKNALQRTTREEFEQVVELGKKATSDDRAITPIEYVGKKAIDALKAVQSKLSEAGKLKDEFMGIGGGATTPVKNKMLVDFKQGVQSFLNSKTATEGDSKLFRDIAQELKTLSDTPSAGQVDKFIDFVQDKIYTSKRDLTLPTTNEATAQLRSLLSALNRGLKSQLPKRYSELNEEYSKLISLRNELNLKLGASGEKAGALMKRFFSPSDNRTKVLFEEMGKLTGVDFAKEARLAKFVMEALGDKRVESLLEQVPLSGGQALSKLLNFVVEKTGIKDPIEAARRFIETQ